MSLPNTWDEEPAPSLTNWDSTLKPVFSGIADYALEGSLYASCLGFRRVGNAGNV